MADDTPRRSSRATKGQHTKLDLGNDIESPTAQAPKSRGRPPKTPKNISTETTENETESEEIIRCICGAVTEDDDDYERLMIACDKCSAWQHNECMELKAVPDLYYCELCSPEDHKNLLEKVSRGEKPWEDIARAREAAALEKKPKKKKGGKKAKAAPKGKPTDVQVEKNVGVGDDGAKILNPAQDKPGRHQTPPKPAGNIGNKRKLKVELDDVVVQKEEPQTKIRRVSQVHINPSLQSSPTEPQRSPAVFPSPAQTGIKIPKFQNKLLLNISDHDVKIRQNTCNLFLKAFTRQIDDLQKKGSYTIPEGLNLESMGTHFSLMLEHALFLNYSNQPGEPTNAYRDKARSIASNLKQNPALTLKLLKGTISPDDLSLMTSDQMASDELKQMKREMRRENENHYILQNEDGPRIRRTHKGEELVGDLNEDNERRSAFTNDSMFSAPPLRKESLAEEDPPKAASPPVDTASPMSVEIPESQPSLFASTILPEGGNRKPSLNVTTNMADPVDNTETKTSDSQFNIKDVWSSVQSTPAEPLGTHRIRRPSIPTNQYNNKENPQNGSAVDLAIDALLQDEELESPPYSPTEPGTHPDAVWRGLITMPNVASFIATARHVAGGDLSAKIPWSKLIHQSLVINARIKIENANEYLVRLRNTSNDLIVIAISPVPGPDSEGEYKKLFNYLNDRGRFGVVAKTGLNLMRDIYVIPLEAGSGELPAFLQYLEYCKIEPTSRPDRTILVTFVVKVPENGGASTDPLSGVVASNFPSPIVGDQPNITGNASGPVLQQQAPNGFDTPLPSTAYHMAVEVLGPLANSPVIQELLKSAPDIGPEELTVVRGILEETPAACDSLGLLTDIIKEKGKQQGL
ncbi:MAG: hypothetical protein M1829_006043 [Trizodia sp. TS-e1964]|nr:MAG: hypothetical protein M1829_006043 [Trizodia sp. TS-e1964]